MKAEIILRSKNIFTATDIPLLDGYVAIANGKIISIDEGSGEDFICEDTIIYELGDKLVSPGFIDVHCFFTGYVLGFVGVDLSKAENEEDIISLVKTYLNSNPSKSLVLGHGWNSDKIKSDDALLDNYFKNIPVILFSDDGETCLMNELSVEKYKFNADTCYPEAYWRLLREIISDKDFIVLEFKKYMEMMNSNGITMVKEMGFDDFYGFTEILKELEENDELTLRTHFMSQPVGYVADINYGKEMRSKFTKEFVRFSGYNRMTDGSISQMCADLKEPYNCANTYCEENIDYDTIEKEVLDADAEGFRFSLHAQGDAAISKVLDIYDKCQKDIYGKLVNRHSITDLEFSDPYDLERMGKLGVIAEIYPQIQSLSDRESKLEMIENKIGKKRGQYYWNRRKMADSDVVITCATDLPLLIDDIPESIYHAVGGFFENGGEPFNVQNTLTVDEVLNAWTKGGAYNLYQEEFLGTLEIGKLADIAVLSENIYITPLEDVKDVEVCLTIVNGKIVYDKI